MNACLILMSAFLFVLFDAVLSLTRPVYTNHWAVQVAGGSVEADKLAAKYGFRNMGKIGSLDDHYHFYHSRTFKRSTFRSRGRHDFIGMEPKVQWIEQQQVKGRVKRQVLTDLNHIHFSDPKWADMWYIHCIEKGSGCRTEMNILAAWQRGYTGKGIVVTILDDGLERNHPDLKPNYDPRASYDVNSEDDDPTPRYDISNENKHGTRCAGEVAAVANNSQCIVGIAYNARIGGVRMLDGDVTDVVEAKSLGIGLGYVDIYSASWGPDDDGKTVDGPGPLARRAFEQGIKKGRKGLGSIYVWASGNGGKPKDHCSCDGYTNSIYTISVSSTTESGNKPWYLEECSSTMATTYSSGEFYDQKIVTTDMRLRCTDAHTGTSVSAPMVAGIIALALEANPLLTWRDVQHLIIKTSRPAHLKAPDWKVNAAGFSVSHLYGFGLIDAEAMVLEAKKWKTVPVQRLCIGKAVKVQRDIQISEALQSTFLSTGCSDAHNQHVTHLEHVIVRVTVVHPRRGDLQINLISPSGTKSHLLARRAYDYSGEGFKHWEFMSVHYWGEQPAGEWTLEIYDVPTQMRRPRVHGTLEEWTLILYGTSEYPYSRTSAHSRSRMLEIPSRENAQFRLDSTTSPHEITEDDEEYNGPCHQECGGQGCDGPDAHHCWDCIHYSIGSTKSGRICVNSCPPGFFGDNSTQKCRRCHKVCEACTGRSQNDCTSCKKWYYHLQQDHLSCVLTCPSGFYGDERQRQCLQCASNCSKCNESPETCTECKAGFRLIGTICVPDCNPGSFVSLGEVTCDWCPQSCFSCTFSWTKECAYCAKSLPLEWKCVSSCSMGFYPEEVPGLPYKVCKRCEENCISCESPRGNCLQCKDGYVLYDGACTLKSTCENGDNIICEMVKSSNLCLNDLLSHYCCRSCRSG
ncbi:proprotein convertase subtilisin/kexin type 6 [Protopterus annectens]|uniref:proprotein convertase subtilisin/kexin type 6 n=1 Tax=Protopterus annectens TaxID=7888 RepID=UPI001CFAE6A7|nr:proprotein convertase subtilisin/kexin type 6 [Protopterus annectens]